ncbi:MAG: hypothetical protein M1416_03655, partial [Candidatus Pacearchaeota archaeon]|nr:hypothetical protein [Candidatus Pacearchaeota archaeon]
MKNISKVAIVGSSFEGHDTIKRIFGNFKVGKENVVVLVPHILTGNIYSYLKGKKKRIYPIYDG